MSLNPVHSVPWDIEHHDDAVGGGRWAGAHLTMIPAADLALREAMVGLQTVHSLCRSLAHDINETVSVPGCVLWRFLWFGPRIETFYLQPIDEPPLQEYTPFIESKKNSPSTTMHCIGTTTTHSFNRGPTVTSRVSPSSVAPQPKTKTIAPTTDRVLHVVLNVHHLPFPHGCLSIGKPTHCRRVGVRVEGTTYTATLVGPTTSETSSYGIANCPPGQLLLREAGPGHTTFADAALRPQPSHSHKTRRSSG